MENIIWKAITKTGDIICEQQGNVYNNFTNLNKENLSHFSLLNKNNNGNYMLNLNNGQFIFNGIPVSPTLQCSDIDIDCICNQKFDYAKRLFWYCEMVNDFNLVSSVTRCSNIYMGYSIDLNVPYSVCNDINGIITKARPMLKIQRSNNRVSLSVQFTFKYEKDGIEKIILL